jgi:hypothetical protein
MGGGRAGGKSKKKNKQAARNKARAAAGVTGKDSKPTELKVDMRCSVSAKQMQVSYATGSHCASPPCQIYGDEGTIKYLGEVHYGKKGEQWVSDE